MNRLNPSQFIMSGLSIVLNWFLWVLVVIDARGVDPEESLDTIGTIKRWGYPAERHSVTTSDRYILELHRIPYGKQGDNQKQGKGRPVVLVMHGLLSSSANWIDNLPSQSAGFVFADAGYDVWLGNLRGNTYGMKHVALSARDTAFWQFSWDEMAKYDLPAIINYVLSSTGETKLNYVGHSMGAMTAFAAFGKDATLRKKINKFFGLGPVANLQHTNGLLQLVANLGPLTQHQFAPTDPLLARTGQLCAKLPSNNPCDNALFLIAGPSTQMNSSRTAVYFSHTPAGTSSRTVMHFSQLISSRRFQAYDYRTLLTPLANVGPYGSVNPPVYDLSAFNVPTYLYYGSEDWLATAKDINSTMIPKLPQLVQSTFLPGFNHLDFLWGLNATDLVYKPIAKIMQL